jgi:hypothetical protein
MIYNFSSVIGRVLARFYFVVVAVSSDLMEET